MAGETRSKLLNAALRLLASDGPEALQARKLASEVGASTMAVYTHFGGMPELRNAVMREGFIRLDRRLEQIPRTADAMMDLLHLGVAYRDHALEHPQLYQLMFGLAVTGGAQGKREAVLGSSPADQPEGEHAYNVLVEGLQRVIAADLIKETDAAQAAEQMWSAIHGYVLLEIAGFLGAQGLGVQNVLKPLAVNILIGMGAEPERVRCSAEAVPSVAGTSDPGPDFAE